MEEQLGKPENREKVLVWPPGSPATLSQRISDDIINSRLDHTKPIDGDHGIQFEQDPRMPKMDHESYRTLFRPTANA